DYGLANGDYISAVALVLIKLGQLDAATVVNSPNYVLDASEVAAIQTRTVAFNQIIQDVADSYGMPVVDIHSIYADMTANPPVFYGIPLTTKFLGGIFSLDGVHPSNIAHALIANAFIDKINQRFNARLHPIDQNTLNSIFLKDPFVDKDGDGKVTGRPNIGLLETLAPIIGISGDTNDAVPAAAPSSLINPESGTILLQEYHSFAVTNPASYSAENDGNAAKILEQAFLGKAFGKGKK
ncbi:MAG: hypothetical protein V2A74_11510, partial [bacterium]